MKLISTEAKNIYNELKDAFSVIVKGHKKAFKWLLAFWSLYSLLELCVPIVSAIVITKIQDSFDSKTLTGILIFWLIFNASFGRLLNFFRWFLYDLENLIDKFLSNRLFGQNFKRLLSMPPLVLENQQSAKILSNLHSLTGSLSQIYRFSWEILSICISWGGATLILLKEKPSFALITFICSLIQLYTTLQITKHLSKEAEFTKKHIQIDSEKTDHLDNMVNINTLAIQNQVIREVKQKMDNQSWSRYKASTKQTLFHIFAIFWQILPVAITSLLAAQEALQTRNIGRFVLLTGMVTTMVRAALPFINNITKLVETLQKYEKVKHELRYDHTLDLKFGTEKLPNGGTIEMKKVSFTYPEEKSPVLKGLSLKIKQGDRVAIIGNSGMGKSTLINVMQHAYEIQGGEVSINGKNVRKISLQSLKQNITYINQTPIFWKSKTIRENLLMFNPKATEVEIYQALQSANLLKGLTRKEKGIDSKVTALSAGEKQRLSLARALLRHTPIIIMDEPTANLDTQAQTKVLEGIKNLSKGKGQKPTVIFASNVPAEIASANRVLLLENGQIVEDGNPKKLMANPKTKVYNRLKRYKSLFGDTK